MHLVERRLPAEFIVSGDGDAWALVAHALLSRMTSTLASIMQLQRSRHAVDAGTLTRSLYEHVVHLAWLAADPSAARIEEWRKYDLRERQKAANDAPQRGIELFDPAERAALDAQVASLQGNDLYLEQLAQKADGHWNGKLPGMGKSTERDSFRGLYVIVYRQLSGTSHPTFRGINPVVEDLPGNLRRVVLEADHPHRARPPYRAAMLIYALGLYVAAEALGLIDPRDIDAAFAR
jgi:hypothetical protein